MKTASGLLLLTLITSCVTVAADKLPHEAGDAKAVKSDIFKYPLLDDLKIYDYCTNSGEIVSWEKFPSCVCHEIQKKYRMVATQKGCYAPTNTEFMENCMPMWSQYQVYCNDVGLKSAVQYSECIIAECLENPDQNIVSYCGALTVASVGEQNIRTCDTNCVTDPNNKCNKICNCMGCEDEENCN